MIIDCIIIFNNQHQPGQSSRNRSDHIRENMEGILEDGELPTANKDSSRNTEFTGLNELSENMPLRLDSRR